MACKLRVMVGIPGSGKSTWIKKAMNSEESSICISRDAIRKAALARAGLSADDYFSKEDEVFKEFVHQINEAMNSENFDSVFVDATHISKGSRAKLLRELRPARSTDLIFEVICCGLETCLERNAKRSGFARVPDSALLSMWKGFRKPTAKEFENNQYGFNSVTINLHNSEKGESD